MAASDAGEKGGLDGVVAGQTAIAHVDGERGELVYRGYSIADLAERTSFEDVAYLLWRGELPERRDSEAMAEALAAARYLPRDVLDHLRSLPRRARPIDALRTLVSLLACYEREGAAMDVDQAVRLTGAMLAGLAAFERIRTQMPLVDARPGLGHAASFLELASGERPGALATRAFDAALVLHLEHGFNASTFAARVAASTLAPLHACVTAAVAALEGPLHGGANERVLVMLREVGEPARAGAWVRERLARRERIMGFGHRVYRGEDPRATVLRRLAGELARERGLKRMHATALAIEEAVGAEVGSKGIAVNVDFYSALLYHALGLAPDLFTPIFALARVVGWTAHILEQRADNRLIRPQSRYVGPPLRRR